MSERPHVGLLVTCLVDLVRPQIGFAAVKLLEDSGCDVEVPLQTCCGQPAWNSGADGHATDLARQAIETFESFDYVVAPSGSCAGMIKRHYAEALANEPAYLRRARALAAKTFELVSFLVQVRGFRPLLVQCPARACYHDSCSSLRELGIRKEPRKLLSEVEGFTLSELNEPEVCCGFGGLFSVKYPEISERMVDQKIVDAQNTGADLMVGADLGCLLHLKGRMQRTGLNMRVRHVAEVLAGMAGEPALGEP
ncbi:MAG: (Fe-S)-binding protein [Alphaproteobacteria bacterium]